MRSVVLAGVMTSLVVLLEQALTEVAAHVTLNGEDVIGVILSVIQFNEERGHLDAVYFGALLHA